MSIDDTEFETIEELDQHLAARLPLTGCVFQSLDLRGHTAALLSNSLAGSVFLGCTLAGEVLEHVQNSGGLLFPRALSLPYDTYRSSLYTVEELLAGYDPASPGSYEHTLDSRIYKHFEATGHAKPATITEAFYRRLHDHAVTDALDELLSRNKKVVAIMGGHQMKRDHPDYLTVARIARKLTRSGFLLVSGGGPGAMEATHLGAWFADRDERELIDAMTILACSVNYTPIHDWYAAAFAVRSKYPLSEKARQEYVSVGIPTWHYGHEPPNAFPTYIAKYFANSEREDGLLAIATYGVVFAPGSAGTIQEIFQDAAQNHYRSFKVASPMVFLGEGYWKWTKPVYPLLAQLAAGNEYARFLQITDDPEEVVRLIKLYAPTIEKFLSEQQPG